MILDISAQGERIRVTYSIEDTERVTFFMPAVSKEEILAYIEAEQSRIDEVKEKVELLKQELLYGGTNN